jgi:hypothetical protein
MKLWLQMVVLVAGAAATVRADQYWIAYEGKDFPENEGWTRSFSAGGAIRSLESGALVIDGLASDRIYDTYQWFDFENPKPEEVFVVEWRVLIDGQSEPFDSSVTVARNGIAGDFSLDFAADRVRIRDQDTEVLFSPGEWHEYRIRSSDMQTFSLELDGVFAATGEFLTPSILEPFVSFGDEWIGRASRSQWDYMRFGVVPECSSSMGIIAALWFVPWKKRR